MRSLTVGRWILNREMRARFPPPKSKGRKCARHIAVIQPQSGCSTESRIRQIAAQMRFRAVLVGANRVMSEATQEGFGRVCGNQIGAFAACAFLGRLHTVSGFFAWVSIPA